MVREEDLNSTIIQLDLVNFYGMVQPITAEYTFFSCVHEAVIKINHILDYKINLNKFKIIDIIQSLCSHHKEIKLEIGNRKISGKSSNIWKLSSVLLNKPEVNNNKKPHRIKLFPFEMKEMFKIHSILNRTKIKTIYVNL